MYADISAGRGALSLVNESMNNLRGAHANMANTMANFSAQINQAGANAQKILENEDLKAYQKMRDNLADQRAQQAQDFRQEVFNHNQRMDLAMQGFRENQAKQAQEYQQQIFKHQQGLDRINNAIKTQQLKMAQAQNKANVAKTEADTLAKNAQNFILGSTIGTGGSAEHIKAANELRKKLLDNFNPPPLQKPIKNKMITPPLTQPNTPTTAQFNPMLRP
ncbi:PspA/IM30 family protein [Helicobacter suis]|uniref:PspA/IM30 family protein n=1 Tax=Helicobacter suis TaxID=104628 RepID=UPI0013D47317|nr:hypothetical protein [Helicobacter suis]